MRLRIFIIPYLDVYKHASPPGGKGLAKYLFENSVRSYLPLISSTELFILIILLPMYEFYVYLISIKTTVLFVVCF